MMEDIVVAEKFGLFNNGEDLQKTIQDVAQSQFTCAMKMMQFIGGYTWKKLDTVPALFV